MDQIRRGWSEVRNWWYCGLDRGEWSSIELQFTQAGNEKLLEHCDDSSELQVLGLLQFATHVRNRFYVSEGRCIVQLLKFLQTADNPTPSLESLEISYREFNQIAIQPVFVAMRSGKLNLLKSLKLERLGLDDADLEILAEAIESGHLPHLKHLILRGHLAFESTSRNVTHDLRIKLLPLFTTGSGHLALGKAMVSGRMVSLERLHLDGTGTGEAGCKAYASALSSRALPSLLRIQLGYNNIGIGGVTTLGRAIRSGDLKNLAHLYLGYNRIADDGMIALASSFQVGNDSVLPNLSYLGLNNNPFTEVGMLSIAEALESGRLDSLQLLDLEGSHNASDVGAGALVSALASNQYLIADVRFEWHMFPDLDRRKKELRERNLRNVNHFAALRTSKGVPPEFGKVYLCGDPEVGKTTLRRTMQRSFLQSLFTWETRRHEEKRTRGIDVSYFSSKSNEPGENPITLLVWDMAGQEDYHLVHNAFFPDLGFGEGQATTFVVVCTSKKDFKECVIDLEKWMRFIASSCDKTIRNLRHVFVVLNNIGGDPKTKQISEEWKEMLQYQKEKFASYLEIRTDVFIEDVRQRKCVRGLKKSLLEHSRNLFRNKSVPEICQLIERNLGAWSKARRNCPVLHWTEFVSEVQRSRQRWPEETLEAATKYLNEAGVLIYIDTKFPSEWGIPHRKLVVLNPNWVCREVAGNMFLPQDMATLNERPFRSEVNSTTGSISIAGFKKFFKSSLGKWSYSEFEGLITILLWLGLCYKDRENLFIPSLIAEDGTPGYPWGPHTFHKDREDQWVMGFSIEHHKTELTLAPIALWHRYQVGLAQTPKFNWQFADHDFVADKYFVTFNVDFMNVLIKVNANQGSPTFDDISIFVMPLLEKRDHLEGNDRRQRQVDLANDLVEILLKLWHEICPGVEYLHRVVWPWPVALACIAF
ncbi:unnamed protein product [Calypogeia fissa]